MPTVGANGERRLARGGEAALHLREAEKMPDLLLGIVRVDGHIGCKLLGAVVEAFGVVQGEASLPEVRLHRRLRAYDLIIHGDGFLHLVVCKQRHALARL